MSERAPVLECRGLAKTYRSGALEVPVLLGIDMSVSAGERVAGEGSFELRDCDRAVNARIEFAGGCLRQAAHHVASTSTGD